MAALGSSPVFRGESRPECDGGAVQLTREKNSQQGRENTGRGGGGSGGKHPSGWGVSALVEADK